MATIIWPNPTRGMVRPYGYATKQTCSGTTAIYVGVPSDVHEVGAQVSGITTGYFLEASMNTPTEIEAGNGVWFDLLGNGTDAQTTAKQTSFTGAISCLRFRGSAGGAAATLNVEFRRV